MAAAAAASLVASPVLAAPAMAVPTAPSAAKLSLGPAARAGTASSKSTKLGDGNGGYIVAAIAAAAVIVGVILIADRGDNPNSP